MTALLAPLTTIILPILLVAGFGFLLRRTGIILETRPLARSALYFFTPALVLSSVARSHLSDADFASLLLFSFFVTAVMGAICYLLTRLLNFDRLLSSAFLLSVLFVNAGNIGLPFNQFAYGQAGLARAAIFFVGSSILLQTLAIFIASRGRSGVRDSVIAVFKMPLVYAVAVGVLLNRLNLALPDTLARALDLAASGAIPVMLIVLGLELARARLADSPLAILLATALKLLVTAAVALLLAEMMGMRGLTRSVAVLEASMPTAVNASIIAVEFDARPGFVTGVVLFSTLAGLLTLTLLLLLLGYPAV